jgi:hypothetical protein
MGVILARAARPRQTRDGLENRRGLSPFCGVFGAKWDCPLLHIPPRSPIGYDEQDGRSRLSPAERFSQLEEHSWNTSGCEEAKSMGLCE